MMTHTILVVLLLLTVTTVTTTATDSVSTTTPTTTSQSLSPTESPSNPPTPLLSLEPSILPTTMVPQTVSTSIEKPRLRTKTYNLSNSTFPRKWIIPAFAGLCTLALFLLAMYLNLVCRRDPTPNQKNPKNDLTLFVDHPELFVAQQILKGQDPSEHPLIKILRAKIDFDNIGKPVLVKSITSKRPEPIEEQESTTSQTEDQSRIDDSTAPGVAVSDDRSDRSSSTVPTETPDMQSKSETESDEADTSPV